MRAPARRRLRDRLPDQLSELLPVGPHELGDAQPVDVGHDDLPDLVLTTVKMPSVLHPLRLAVVVLGRREVVDRRRLVAVDQEEVHERHQPLRRRTAGERVLVADREDAAAAAILHAWRRSRSPASRRRAVEHASSSRSEPARVRPQLDAERPRPTPWLAQRRATPPGPWSAPRSAPGAGAGSSPRPSPWSPRSAPKRPSAPRPARSRRPGSAACGRATRAGGTSAAAGRGRASRPRAAPSRTPRRRGRRSGGRRT